MEVYLSLFILLVSGAVGGNVAGKILKHLSFGRLGNSISGILGGGLGGYLLTVFGANMGVVANITEIGLSNIIGGIASGGIGGGIIMMCLGYIKKLIIK